MGPDAGPRSRGFHPGMVIGGKFALLRELAAGGMGAVYLATDTRLNRQVAIKLLLPDYAASPERTRRFLREAQATAAIRHPNVVSVFEMGEADGAYFIVEELLDGPSLREHLAARGRVDVPDALEILLPVMSALDAAHRAGIVHRDVKPDNVVLTRTTDGALVPKLIDFGVAKAPRLAKGKPTRVGEQLGTPAYMSPEQARGDRGIDARADVWAVGAVLAEMLTGELVFPGPSDAVTYVQVLTQAEERVARATSKLPEGLSAVVARALATSPLHRFPTMGELKRALLEATSRATTGSVPPPRDSMRDALESLPSWEIEDDAEDGGEDGDAPAPRRPTHDEDPIGRAAREATSALEQNELGVAIAEAQRVLERAGGDDALAARMNLVQAIAHLWLGDSVACELAARRAMERFERGHAGWLVAVGHLATALGQRGRVDELAALYEELRAAPVPDVEAAARAIASARVAVPLLQAGRRAEADALLSTIPHAEDDDVDPLVSAWRAVARSTYGQQRGDPSEYLIEVQRAVLHFTLRGDIRNACLQRVNLGGAFVQLGAYARAEQALSAVLAIAEPMQLALAAPARVNLGFAMARRGKLDAAHGVVVAGMEQATAQGAKRFATVGSGYLAVILAAQGQLEPAEAAARRAVEGAATSPPLRAAANATLAAVLLMRGRAREAMAPARAAHETLARLGGIEESESLVRLVFALALSMTAQPDAAGRAIAEASARVRARAKAIKEPGWRRSFLRNVQENALTVRLAGSFRASPERGRDDAARAAKELLSVPRREGLPGAPRAR